MSFQILLNQLKNELEEIYSSNGDIIEIADLSIAACSNSLLKMSQLISKTDFKNEQEEIHFFKEVKIYPLSNLIYFINLRNFELHFPVYGFEEQKKYLNVKIRKINKFLQNNVEFIIYYKTGKSHFDSFYYTRNKNYSSGLKERDVCYRSPVFSTSHDFLLSKVKGHKLLIKYLRKKISKLAGEQTFSKKSKLKWRLSKTALVELIYGLQSSNAIDAEIGEVKTVFENIFDLKLDNPYRTFSEIKIRKTNRTLFLDKMKTSLEERINESYE